MLTIFEYPESFRREIYAQAVLAAAPNIGLVIVPHSGRYLVQLPTHRPDSISNYLRAQFPLVKWKRIECADDDWLAVGDKKPPASVQGDAPTSSDAPVPSRTTSVSLPVPDDTSDVSDLGLENLARIAEWKRNRKRRKL